MTETEELRLRKLVDSIGASSLYMQWARYYLQRTSDFMRENLNSGIDDLLGEDRIGVRSTRRRSRTALTRWIERSTRRGEQCWRLWPRPVNFCLRARCPT
jgi:hypothetical protein